MATLGGDTRRISKIEDVIALYEGVGTGQGKMGTEIELAFYDAQTLAFMSKAQKQELIGKAREKGVNLNEEPFCDGVEVCSIADTYQNLPHILDDTDQKIKTTVATAAEMGLKRSFFEQSPQVKTEDLLQNIIDNPRYQAFFVPVRKDIEQIARYFVSSKSVQTSVSYETLDHLHRNLRLLNYLAPFLFMLTANNAPFLNNNEERVTYLTGMNYRHALGHLGGVPDYIFTAQSGAELIENHIEAVFNAPVFSIFDHDGKQIKTPEGQWKSLRDLEAEGLNTLQNYFQVQSMLWRDVAIKPFKDEQGELTKHRIEARMFGVGMHQHSTASLITGALAFNENYHHAITELLERYGFSAAKPAETKELLHASYKNARLHNNAYFDVGYGTGTMANFAKELGKITEAHITDKALQDRLLPLLFICETGLCDTKAHYQHLCTLDMVKGMQRHHDNIELNDPHSCAGLYYAAHKELSKCA